MRFLTELGSPADPLEEDEPVSREEAASVHAEALGRLRKVVGAVSWWSDVAAQVFHKWTETGYKFTMGRRPSRREVREFRRLIDDWVKDLGEN